jgi:hypothetical protein
MNTQHEILLSQLKPDLLDEKALESLDTALDKLSQGLRKGGAAAYVAGGAGVHVGGGLTSAAIAGVGALALSAGTWIKIANGLVNHHVYSAKVVEGVLTAIKEKLRVYKLVIEHLPNSLEDEVWEKFDEQIGNEAEKLNRTLGTQFKDLVSQGWVAQVPYSRTKLFRAIRRVNSFIGGTVPFENSGWEVADAQKAAKEVLALAHEYATLSAEFAKKIDTLRTNIRKSPLSDSWINHLVSHSLSFIKDIHRELAFADRAMKGVEHHFEKKK